MEDQKRAYRIPPSRQRKKHLAAFYDEAIIKQVKILLAYRGITLQSLLEEAVSDILKKYKDKFK